SCYTLSAHLSRPLFAFAGGNQHILLKNARIHILTHKYYYFFYRGLCDKTNFVGMASRGKRCLRLKGLERPREATRGHEMPREASRGLERPQEVTLSSTERPQEVTLSSTEMPQEVTLSSTERPQEVRYCGINLVNALRVVCSPTYNGSQVSGMIGDQQMPNEGSKLK
ncbi:hypothetical protein L9F63_028054, partial [Diploptera punctata]